MSKIYTSDIRKTFLRISKLKNLYIELEKIIISSENINEKNEYLKLYFSEIEKESSELKALAKNIDNYMESL